MTYSPFYFSQQGTGTSMSLVTNYTNSSSVNPIPQGTPVSLTGTADFIAPTDVTSQASISAFVGVAQFRIAASGNGPVLSNGRLQNLTGWSFSIGNSIWIGLSGILQSTRPDYGVTGFATGDYVYYIGTIVQNESNSLQQDLVVLPQLIGEL
jgi:hypothetical protein